MNPALRSILWTPPPNVYVGSKVIAIFSASGTLYPPYSPDKLRNGRSRLGSRCYRRSQRDTHRICGHGFSSSKRDYGACSLLPFQIKVPPGTQPIQSRPFRLNPALSKQANAIVDSNLAANLIQHSTSPGSSPLVCVPKESGGIRITVNYQKLNKGTETPQVAILRIDEVLETLGGGLFFQYSIF